MTDLSVKSAQRVQARGLADIVLPLAVLVVLVLQLAGPPGPDVAWLTTVSERILAGQQLYAQILESNPPVAGFLYMPSVLVGRLFGIAPEPLIVFQTVGAALASVLYAAHLVRRYRLIARPESFAPLAFILVGAAWGMDFAQREQFVTMALLPVAVGVAARAKGHALPLATIIVLGLLGGFAAATKPYFVLPLIGAAAFYAIRLKSIRPLFWPEFLIAAALFVVYWAWTWLAFPAYFSQLLPKLAIAYVPDRRALWMLFLNVPAVGYVGVAVLALVASRQHFRLSPLFGALAVFSAGLMVSYLVQSKGYFYQVMPAFALLLLGYVLAFAEAHRDSDKLWDQAMPLALAFFFTVIPAQQLVESWQGRQHVVDYLKSYGPGHRVANLTSDIGLANPAIRQAGDTFINSAPGMLTTLSAWRIRQETRPSGELLAKVDAVEADERATLRDDFKRTPPDLVLTLQDENFDWIAWAKVDAEFARVLDGYEKAADVPFLNYFVAVYRRKGLLPTS